MCTEQTKEGYIYSPRDKLGSQTQTPIHKGWPTERQLACAIQVVEGKMDTHCPVSINQYDIRLIVIKNQVNSGKQWH